MGLADHHLENLLDRNGVRQLRSLVHKHCANSNACAICGRPGAAICPGPDDEDGQGGGMREADNLRFTAWWSTDFSSQSLVLRGAGMCCGLCRAAADTPAVIQSLALAATSDDAAVLGAVAEHVARANGRADGSDPVEFCRGLYNRAYALCVLAGSLANWRFCTGDGGTGAAALLSAVQAMLTAPRVAATPGKKRSKRTATQADTPLTDSKLVRRQQQPFADPMTEAPRPKKKHRSVG